MSLPAFKSIEEVVDYLEQLRAAHAVAGPGFDACIGCGCTNEHACPGSCSWVAPNLCSSCAAIAEDLYRRTVAGESLTPARVAER